MHRSTLRLASLSRRIWWFKGVDSEEAIDIILDGLEDGEAAADYIIAS